jgi:hypothetical protein
MARRYIRAPACESVLALVFVEFIGVARAGTS